jgi:hypothetical protein
MKQNRCFDRLDLLLSAALGLLSLALYVRTLVPWLLPGDSGEFQVLAHQVGIAHTTGYPVYMLLGKLFITLVPADDVAYRVNLFSAFMAAVTIGLVYAAGRLAARSRWGGLFASLALTVSFTFWSQALIAEVYTIGAAFLAAVLVALLAWARTGRTSALAAAGVCGGLGLGAHASVGILAPAVAIYLGLHRARWRASWKPALAGALIGLALYGLAFLAVDLHAPPANIFNAAYGPARSAWGLSAADLQDPIARIVFIGGGRQWRTALYPDPPGMLKKIADYGLKLSREFSLLTLLLAFGGFVALIWRDWRLAVLLGLGLIAQWLFYFNYHVGDIYVFYISGYLLIALLAGAGFAALARRLIPNVPGASQAPGTWQRFAKIIRPLLLIALTAAALQPVLTPNLPAVRKGEAPFLTAREYPANAGTRYLRAEMASIVKELEADAIVFVDWNRLYPLYYAAQVDADRFDLQFIEAKPRSEASGLADSVIEFVVARVDSRPIYSLNRLNELERAGFTFQPVSKGPLRLFKIQRK